MSNPPQKRRLLYLPVLAALVLAALFFLRGGLQESARESDQQTAAASKASAKSDPVQNTSEHARHGEHHAATCAHCSQIAEAEPTADAVEPAQSTKTPSTAPKFDPIFKRINGGKVYVDQAQFDQLEGSQVGETADFRIAGETFSGEVAVVREGKRARAYVIDLPEGNLSVTTDRVGKFRAHLMLNGDSRVVELETHREESAEFPLIASEISVSDVVCAPPGTVYPLGSQQPTTETNFAADDLKEYPVLLEPVSAPPLESKSDAEHVLYIDFDGEVVTGDFWNTFTGVTTIDALPAPRANDDTWTTNVWRRVAEDLAPYDINVTTDRSVYDATVTENRLIAICTPTSTAAPGSGGVAFTFSYSTDLTDIVWVFNLSEYTAASTISHEAGHAFGLSHDGRVPTDEYYGGHNGSYPPGWAPIMGAPWSDEGGAILYDEVDQWSIGEYKDANNDEDDLAIIGGAANGFGFKTDDFANFFNGGTPTIDVGLLSPTGPNRVGATGFITRRFDLDVFRFTVSNLGEVTFRAIPLDVESTDPEPGSNTNGANLAAQVRLLDADGLEIAVGVESGGNLLSSEVTADITPGTYYIEVSGAGRGADPDTGFSDYASLGEYTIEGELPTQPLQVSSSAPERNEDGKIVGPGKLDQPVLPGDTITSRVNGTDFGFSYPGNQILHQFLLKNTSPDDLTNLTVSLASGTDFKVLSPPGMTLPGNATTKIYIAYDPLASGTAGLDSDTVVINYDSFKPETFDFAISGLATISEFKDNYENNPNNDVSWRASDLAALENTWISDFKGPALILKEPYVHTDQIDFYTFNANPGDLITVDVAYDEAQGPIAFELRGVRNGKEIVLGTTSTGTGKVQFLFRSDSAFSGKFYIRAFSEDNEAHRRVYDLRWSTITAAGTGDDFYEDNDFQSQAFDLTGVNVNRLSDFLGLGISNDEDWYKIEIPADPFVRMLYVRAEFTHADGNIDIQIIPDSETGGFGFQAGTGTSLNDYEVITYYETVSTEDFADNFSPDGNIVIMGVEPGTYFIRVFGDLAGNEYDLIFDTPRDDAYEVIDPSAGTENDFRINPFVLGEAAIGRWLSEIDGIGTSSAYGANATKENFVNRADNDYYEFTIPSGTQVGQIAIEFESSAGGIMEFTVFDSSGTRVGQSFETVGNVTTFFGIGTFTIPNPTDNTYTIQVRPFADVSALSAYDFRVTILEDPPVLDVPDDAYEENDNFTEPYDLSGNEGFWLTAENGFGIQLDPDWYEITVPEGASELFVETTFNSAAGDINLSLSRKDGPLLFRAEEGTDGESILWEDPEPGKYAVTVSGANTGNQYNLFWDAVFAEDNYEENDVLADAFDISGHEKQLLSKLNGEGIQVDEDWYRIEVTGTRAELRVLADFAHADGDVDIELYNAAGFLLEMRGRHTICGGATSRRMNSMPSCRMLTKRTTPRPRRRRLRCPSTPRWMSCSGWPRRPTMTISKSPLEPGAQAF